MRIGLVDLLLYIHGAIEYLTWSLLSYTYLYAYCHLLMLKGRVSNLMRGELEQLGSFLPHFPCWN